MDPRQMVRAGYDRIAEGYLSRKDPDEPVTLASLERLAHTLSPAAAVLDLGCGAGVPVTRWLAERFAVTAVDLSARQLALARERVPRATFVQADMAALDFRLGAFDAVVAFCSIIHVPRAGQPFPPTILSPECRAVNRFIHSPRQETCSWALGGLRNPSAVPDNLNQVPLDLAAVSAPLRAADSSGRSGEVLGPWDRRRRLSQHHP